MDEELIFEMDLEDRNMNRERILGDITNKKMELKKYTNKSNLEELEIVLRNLRRNLREVEIDCRNKIDTFNVRIKNVERHIGTLRGGRKRRKTRKNKANNTK